MSITDELNVDVSTDVVTANPGDGVVVSGSAYKLNGEIVEAKIASLLTWDDVRLVELEDGVFEYNLVLPIFVAFLGLNILSKRPTGYGESDILREHPEYKRFQKIKFLGMRVSPAVPALVIGLPIVLLGLFPWWINVLSPGFDFAVPGGQFLDYQSGNGPYGAGALIMGLLVPIGFAIGIGIYYRLKTKRLIKIKQKINKLEYPHLIVCDTL